MTAATKQVAELAREDPNVFAEYIHERPQAEIHRVMQSWWTLHPDSDIEQHRGIGKTVQAITRCAWDIGKRPDVRIKYVQQSDDEAKKSVRLLKQLLESNRYKEIFPHIEPDRTRWGSHQLSVMGSSDRDATVQASGIFGNAGGRFDIIIFDDICDLKNSVQQPAKREQVKEAYANTWLPMADPSRGIPTQFRRLCTPYHVDDITQEWRRWHEDEGTLLRCPVVDFVSPWSEVFTPDMMKTLRKKGKIAYARAYELVPVSSEILIFPCEWLDAALYVGDIPHDQKRRGKFVAAVDFAFTEKKQDNDPDYSVCLIGWQSSQGHIWVVDMVRTQSSFPDFCRKALSKCAQWNVEKIRAEGNGPQKGLVQQMNREASIPVTPITRDTDKITRAAEKQEFVESGRFHLPARIDGGVRRPIETIRAVYDEMTTFPAGGHDDCVDAAIDLMATKGGSVISPVIRVRNPDRARAAYGVA